MVTDLTPTLMWEEPGDADDAVASMGGQLSPFISYQMGGEVQQCTLDLEWVVIIQFSIDNQL